MKEERLVFEVSRVVQSHSAFIPFRSKTKMPAPLALSLHHRPCNRRLLYISERSREYEMAAER